MHSSELVETMLFILRTRFIMTFKRDEYHELCIWETLRNKTTHRGSRSQMFFKIGVLKNFTISRVFSRNNSGGCFLTQLLLHRKTDFCDIPRGIRLINNWLSFIYTCWISVFYAVIFYLKGHSSISIKKAFRNIHRKAPVFLIKGTPNY